MEPRQDRNLDHLHPDFRSRLEQWLAAASKAGFDILVYETFRTPERQKWLFEAGRQRPPFGRYLTYTMDSCHRYGLAADLVVLVSGVADWDGYDKLYKAVDPKPFGLELLDFERPHIQIEGGQGYARSHGISRDVIIGSKAAPVATTVANSVKIPLYSAMSNKLIGEVTLVKKPDGSFKAYQAE